MKKRRLILRTTILVIFVIALGYTIYSSVFQSDKTVLEVNEKAPNFSLNDLDGKEYELDQLQGKGVFLNFWGTYCPPCEKEMPAIQNQFEVYNDQNIEVLAVNLGETNLVVNNFVERKGLTFPILLDQEKDLVDVYDIGLLPVTFLIDKDGVIIDRVTGELTDEVIQNMMEKIKP